MQHRRWMMLAAIAAGAMTDAGATGTIDSTGAAIAAGTSPGITGTVLVDPCAEGGAPPALPPIAPLGTIGAMTNLPPAFPGGGTGADGAFRATTNQSLPGGTYNFTTYDVDAGVTVTYSGAVTIRATGIMFIQGHVVTTAAAAPITLRCAANLALGGDFGNPGSVRTSGTASPIAIGVQQSISFYSQVVVSATSGNVSIVSHGDATPGNGTISLDRARIRTTAGDISIQGEELGIANGTEIDATDGDVLVQAYGGGSTFVSSSFARTGHGRVVVEVMTYLRLFYGSFASSTSGDVFVRSFGERVEFISQSYAAAYGGNVTIGAAQYVTFTESSYAQTGQGGDIDVTAFGGDVWIEPPQVDGCAYLVSGGGISVAASGNVFLNGDSYFTADAGDIVVRAIGGDVSLSKSPAIIAAAGAIDLRAFNAIVATDTEVFPVAPKAAPGSTITLDANSIALSSGAGGIDVPLERATARSGPLTAISQGPVAVGGAFTSEGDMTLASCDGTVDIVSATLRTEDRPGAAAVSGDILVASYAGSSGSILAANAIVRSGDAPGASGNVTVAVYDAAWGTVVVDSFFLPKKVAYKRNAAAPAQSVFNASGFFDTGSKVVDLTAAATLSVGGFDIPVPSLTASKNGRTFTYQAGGVKFVVVKNPFGSSRAKFRLTYTGDLGASVPTNGKVQLRFANDAVDGSCEVLLENGGFRIGRKRGALSKPNVFVVRSHAFVNGGGRDSLAIIVGLATGGVTPATAPEVRVQYGSLLTSAIPATSFVRKGDSFVFKGDIGGITGVTLDFLREQVTIVGKNLDLGTFPAGQSPLTIIVGVGTDDRGVAIRVARQGNLLKY